MEFASSAEGRKYCTATLAFLSAEEMALITDLRIECFEDATSADAAASLPESAAVLGTGS